jgi:hypothetical protein
MSLKIPHPVLSGRVKLFIPENAHGVEPTRVIKDTEGSNGAIDGAG